MLRRIFGRKRKEVVGGWTRLYNGKLHKCYASPNVIRVINEWAGRVARMRREMHPKFWSENLKGRHCLGDIGVDGRRILKRSSDK